MLKAFVRWLKSFGFGPKKTYSLVLAETNQDGLHVIDIIFNSYDLWPQYLYHEISKRICYSIEENFNIDDFLLEVAKLDFQSSFRVGNLHMFDKGTKAIMVTAVT